MLTNPITITVNMSTSSMSQHAAKLSSNNKLDGKHSERVQIPAKAFLSPTLATHIIY